MAPITVVAPTSIQPQENVFNEQARFKEAVEIIAGLLNRAEAKLPEVKPTPHRYIQVVEIPHMDAEHSEKIRGIYGAVVAEENKRLKAQGIPIQMEVTNTGGSMYFVVAAYEPIEKQHLEFPAIFHLSEITQEGYIATVQGSTYAQEDKDQLLKLIPQIYLMAEAGIVNLSKVAISRTENGNLKIESELPNLSLDTETAESLLTQIIQRTKAKTAKPSLTKFGNATMQLLQDLTKRQSAVDTIKTPQELATEMLAYQDGKRAKPPTANCVELALLTNALLGSPYFDSPRFNSSIMTMHAINQYGNEETGHASAAVVADSALIDPALQDTLFHVRKVSLDKKSSDYVAFSDSMHAHYLGRIRDLSEVPEDRKPTFLEFGIDTNQAEILSFYLLAKGTVLYGQGVKEGKVVDQRKVDEARLLFVEAARINPGNFYATQIASGIFARKENKNSDELKEETMFFRQMEGLNSDLYIAHHYAAIVLYNNQESDTTGQFLQEAFRHAKKAVELMEADGQKFYYGYQWLEITAAAVGDTTTSKEADRKMKECTPP